MTNKIKMIAVLLYNDIGEFKFYLGEEHETVKKIYNFVRRGVSEFKRFYPDEWWHFHEKEVYDLGDLEHILGTELFPDFAHVSATIFGISGIVGLLNDVIECKHFAYSSGIPPVLEDYSSDMPTVPEEYRDAIVKKVMKIALSRFNKRED